MNNEQYNQIIDEAYENYITKCRENIKAFRKENPFTFVDYQEDTKEQFIKSIKDDKHHFTGDIGFSEKWSLKIEERELSLEERKEIYQNKFFGGFIVEHDAWLESKLKTRNIPTKLTTVIYKDNKIEIVS